MQGYEGWRNFGELRLGAVRRISLPRRWVNKTTYATLPTLHQTPLRCLADPVGEEEAPPREGEAADTCHGEQRVPPTRRHKRPHDRDGRPKRGQRGGPKHRAARRLGGERKQKEPTG